MMSLYNIDLSIQKVLENSIDPETGEVNQETIEQLNSLSMERTNKMENIGCFIKNLNYEIADLKTEEENLKLRRHAKEKKIDFLKNLVSSSLIANGERKFETPKVSLSFRKSEQVVITCDTAELDKHYLKEKVTVIVDKTAIKKAIKSGEQISGAELQERLNLQVK